LENKAGHKHPERSNMEALPSFCYTTALLLLLFTVLILCLSLS